MVKAGTLKGGRICQVKELSQDVADQVKATLKLVVVKYARKHAQQHLRGRKNKPHDLREANAALRPLGVGAIGPILNPGVDLK